MGTDDETLPLTIMFIGQNNTAIYANFRSHLLIRSDRNIIKRNAPFCTLHDYRFPSFKSGRVAFAVKDFHQCNYI